MLTPDVAFYLTAFVLVVVASVFIAAVLNGIRASRKGR